MEIKWGVTLVLGGNFGDGGSVERRGDRSRTREAVADVGGLFEEERHQE